MTKRDRDKFTKRAQDLVDQMSLEEQVALMSGQTTLGDVAEAKREGFHFNYEPFEIGGNDRLQIPPIRFADGPRGIVCGEGKSTCFPVPVMRGASFDAKLEREIGEAIGREAKESGANFFGGVCINQPYHPGWGRAQETYGEDSAAIAEMGGALVEGVQGQGVIACLKHFAFNSMENNRFSVNIDCEKRTEQELYLAHFRECVQRGAGAVMTAFNHYKGELCGESGLLLKEILREDWGFDGIVVSDFFWGISDTVLAANAGMDVEMCHTLHYGSKLLDAVENGSVPESAVHEAAVRIVRTLLAFEDAAKQEAEESDRAVCDLDVQEGSERDGRGMSGDHASLALRSAQEGLTLIKNDHAVLPLSKSSKKIAVFGRLAAAPNTGDRGSSRVYPRHVVTPLEGIVSLAKDSSVIYYDGNDLDHIKELASDADAAVFVVGLDYQDEGEFDPIKRPSLFQRSRGGDRKSLKLHYNEQQMLREAGGVNPNTAVVLMGGGTITVSEWEQTVPAILHAFYPGQEGGTAIAQVLFGEVNPSGKLPFVLPWQENDLPQIDWEADEQFYGYDHGYHLLDRKGIRPYRPYGFGLSYTTFEIRDVQVRVRDVRPKAFQGEDLREKETGSGQVKGSVCREQSEDAVIEASALLSNTGERAGAQVLQLYAGFSNSAVPGRPVRTLVGFSRTVLEPGEEKRVTVICPVRRLSYFDEKKGRSVLEHMTYEMFLGSSEALEDLVESSITL